eukprot:4948483-Amphidinium_carterae.1
MGEDAKKQYVTVTGEGLTIDPWSALLGLLDLNKNKVTFHTGVFPYIEKHSETTSHKALEPLQSRGAHIHAASIVLDGFYKPHNIYLDS